MKKNSQDLSWVIASAIVFTSIGVAVPRVYDRIGYSVQQEVGATLFDRQGVQMKTYVWHNGDIVYSWYDEIKTVNKELVHKRQKQADSLVSALKEMNKVID